MMEALFKRTECGCADCVTCCTEQPGSLIPGDMERIATYLNTTVDAIKTNFWSSDGALVMNRTTGVQFRVRTITPKLERHRGCVFLGADNRCTIHPVAPAGCSYFDTHMSPHEGQKRGVEVVRHQQDHDYQALRRTLDVATSYKPRRY